MSRKNKDWRVARPVNIADQAGPEIRVTEVSLAKPDVETTSNAKTLAFTATPESAKSLTDTEVKRREQEIPKCRQCPICWNGLRGVGRAANTAGRCRSYKCDQCGHNWKYMIPTDVVLDPMIYDAEMTAN